MKVSCTLVAWGRLILYLSVLRTVYLGFLLRLLDLVGLDLSLNDLHDWLFFVCICLFLFFFFCVVILLCITEGFELKHVFVLFMDGSLSLFSIYIDSFVWAFSLPLAVWTASSL